MKNYFITIANMCITEELPSLVIVHKIMKYHIKPMQKVYNDLGFSISCSDSKGLRSCYRPYRWERSRNRLGDSEHTFGQGKKGKIKLNKKGASDWRCEDFQFNKTKFLNSIIKNTNFTRIIIYNHHIHTDYKCKNGNRYVYSSNNKKLKLLIKL